MKNWQKKLKIIAFWTIWPIIVFIGSQYLLGFILTLIFGENLKTMGSSPMFSTIVSVLSYALMIIFVLLLPNKILKNKPELKVTKKDIGLTGWPTWMDILLGFAGLIVSMILAAVITAVISSIIPGFDEAQKQDVGFSSLNGSFQYVLAFITLVVAAPFAEEFLCRGVIYGKMREAGPWLAMVIVSIMFGAAHGQWNVGITTFAMSIVMCFMREKFTKTIWSSIILHALKNGLAFYFLYIAPDLLQLMV